MNLARNYNFAPLARAAALENLYFGTPSISTRTHGFGVPIHGSVVWRRKVGNLLVDDCPRKHDYYRTKVNGKQYTIAKNAPIDALRQWIKKLNSI